MISASAIQPKNVFLRAWGAAGVGEWFEWLRFDRIRKVGQWVLHAGFGGKYGSSWICRARIRGGL